MRTQKGSAMRDGDDEEEEEKVAHKIPRDPLSFGGEGRKRKKGTKDNRCRIADADLRREGGREGEG